jgi:hypothetical protein
MPIIVSDADIKDAILRLAENGYYIDPDRASMLAIFLDLPTAAATILAAAKEIGYVRMKHSRY